MTRACGLVLVIALVMTSGCDRLGRGTAKHAGNVVDLTERNWEDEVERSKQPVLVCFWAEWCGPCRTFEPTIDKIAADFAGKIKVGRVNVDAAPDIANAFAVKSIPRVIIFTGDRKAVGPFVGVLSEAELSQAIESVLAEK
jgi:thioredoxin 1